MLTIIYWQVRISNDSCFQNISKPFEVVKYISILPNFGDILDEQFDLNVSIFIKACSSENFFFF